MFEQTCLPLWFRSKTSNSAVTLAGSKITVTVQFFLSRILSWSKTTGTGSKLSKGQNQVMTGNYFPWNTACACSLLKLLLPPSLKCALGRWVKDVLKIWDWLPLPKLRQSNVIAQSTMRWTCLFRSWKGDLFVQHRLHLHTWWWKRLQEAREVQSPQRLWIFWRNTSRLV